MCSSQRRSVLQVRTEHSSRESEGDSQNTPMRGVQQTVVMCDPEVSQRSWIPVCEEFHDEFMMSRWHEPTVMVTRTSVLQDPSSQGPHNDSACGEQHVGVVCLVPACSGARVCQEQRQRRLHWFRGPVNQTVRNWSRSARRPRGTRSEMQ